LDGFGAFFVTGRLEAVFAAAMGFSFIALQVALIITRYPLKQQSAMRLTASSQTKCHIDITCNYRSDSFIMGLTESGKERWDCVGTKPNVRLA
jgi:hypothetical protein